MVARRGLLSIGRGRLLLIVVGVAGRDWILLGNHMGNRLG